MLSTVSMRTNDTAGSGWRDPLASSVWDPNAEEDDLEEGFGISRELPRISSERRKSLQEQEEQLVAQGEEACADLRELAREEVRTCANHRKCLDLKALLITLLEDHTVTDHDKVGRNQLVSSIVDLIRALANFGFYHVSSSLA